MAIHTRVERRLGWVTVDGQRYPREKASDWLDAIAKQLCPFCGEGPFIVVAIHVYRRHGIDRYELRDLLGIRQQDSICDPLFAAARREEGRQRMNLRNPRPVATGTRRRTVAQQSAYNSMRKSHPCAVCGAPIHIRWRATCSDACLAKRRTIAGAEARSRGQQSEVYRFRCPVCGESAEKPAMVVRANRKKGHAGPFCGKSCAAKARSISGAAGS